ncbi:MAG: UDP-3-O-[3-hydroxymyristoyl] glucosamine N-acyltransferase, partial [Nonlabens sp.]
LSVLDTNNMDHNSLAWCSDVNVGSLNSSVKGTVICSDLVLGGELSSECNYIIVSNPRLVFTKIINEFFSYPEISGIALTASIDGIVTIGKGACIGENVVIERDCMIGENVSIGHNTVIKSNTVLGNNVIVGSNCTIGGCGFGYEIDTDGKRIRINHIGGVTLGDRVQVGNNVCIDRGVIGNTILGVGVLVDNLAHISHNVKIGENSMIFALAVICGSTIIGKDSKVCPGASVINKITIGDSAQIGIGAVVVKNVPSSMAVGGYPARHLK